MNKLRKCNDCNVEYEDYGQKTAKCRDCKRKYDREYYRNFSKEKRYNKRNKQNLRIRSNINWLNSIKKESCCVDCGNRDFRVFEYDHLPNTNKIGNISDLVTKGVSRKKILEEIKKCEIVCANCHRIRTYNRRLNN